MDSELINAMISSLAFMGLIASILLQKKSIDIQHKELKNSIEEIRNQTEEFKKQNQEHQFKRIIDITYKQIELTLNELNRINPNDKSKTMHSTFIELLNSIRGKNAENLISNNSIDSKFSKFISLITIVDTSIELIASEQKNSDSKIDFIKLFLVNIDSTLLDSIFYINKTFAFERTNYEMISSHPNFRNLKKIIHLTLNMNKTIEKYSNEIPILNIYKR